MTRSSVQSKGCFDRRVSNEHCMLSGTVFGLACSMAGSSEQISTSSNRVSLWVRYQEQAEPKLSCPSLSWMIVFQTDEESSLPLKIILITTCWRSLAISLRLCFGTQTHEELLMITDMEDCHSAFFMLGQEAYHASCRTDASFAPDLTDIYMT